MTELRKVAVVTGASRGIGRAVAEAFVRDGWTVWALARSADALKSLQEAAPGRVRPLAVDVADEAALTAACRTVLQDGVPGALVNNAGITLAAPLHKTSTADLNRIMAVNVTAPFVLCRELVPAMAKAGGGRVVNVASTAGLRGFRYTSAYCASKHALVGLTRSLAVEWGRKNVTVNAVCPGWTDTDMVGSATSNISKATGRSEEQARQALLSMNAMGRMIHPEEVAGLVLFLAGPAAGGVNGATYTMDGGETDGAQG